MNSLHEKLENLLDSHGPLKIWKSYYKKDKSKPVYMISSEKHKDWAWGKSVDKCLNAYIKGRFECDIKNM